MNTNNSWLDKVEYPFKSNYFDVNGVNLHYVDVGVGPVILFVHGTPSWSFDFRHAIKVLSKDYRCIAIDHVGFGLSDKPQHYDYSTQNHSMTLEKFILEKNLNDVTMLVHDFGGPIGMSVAMRHPERFVRFVILNSWLWSSEDDPGFKRMKKVLKSPVIPFLYRYFNFSPRFILPNSFGEKRLKKDLLIQYTKPFANSTQRNGAIAFVRSLLNDQAWFESLWNSRQVIQNKPILLVWGLQDKVINLQFLEKFQAGFKDVKVEKLETCGHFPQEEEPEKLISAIEKFMK